MRGSRYTARHNEIVELCKSAITFTDVEKGLGITSPNGALRRYIKHNGISMPEFLGQSAAGRQSWENRLGNRITPLRLRKGELMSTTHVKSMLFRERIKTPACEICGWCEKRPSDGKIPVHLHHKDGDSTNWELDNIEILCPNHHALTSNYAGLNKQRV